MITECKVTELFSPLDDFCCFFIHDIKYIILFDEMFIFNHDLVT